MSIEDFVGLHRTSISLFYRVDFPSARGLMHSKGFSYWFRTKISTIAAKCKMAMVNCPCMEMGRGNFQIIMKQIPTLVLANPWLYGPDLTNVHLGVQPRWILITGLVRSTNLWPTRNPSPYLYMSKHTWSSITLSCADERSDRLSSSGRSGTVVMGTDGSVPIWLQSLPWRPVVIRSVFNPLSSFTGVMVSRGGHASLSSITSICWLLSCPQSELYGVDCQHKCTACRLISN